MDFSTFASVLATLFVALTVQLSWFARSARRFVDEQQGGDASKQDQLNQVRKVIWVPGWAFAIGELASVLAVTGWVNDLYMKWIAGPIAVAAIGVMVVSCVLLGIAQAPERLDWWESEPPSTGTT